MEHCWLGDDFRTKPRRSSGRKGQKCKATTSNISPGRRSTSKLPLLGASRIMLQCTAAVAQREAGHCACSYVGGWRPPSIRTQGSSLFVARYRSTYQQQSAYSKAFWMMQRQVAAWHISDARMGETANECARTGVWRSRETSRSSLWSVPEELGLAAKNNLTELLRDGSPWV